MPEIKRIVPCILDPQKLCPEDCKLRPIAEKILKVNMEAFKATDVEEFVILAKGDTKELENLRRENAIMLQRARKIELCANYPDADITRQSLKGPRPN